ncbi:hypothetical protein BGZ80_007705 [Entomortierella chlamydospora]|uniref:EF-hand domain-containing protein n=1 Tax=Entomortierella chlamydospora TaxID=101097 RepID=A0A9P6T4T9_9FUNG|nr:hypothetical protein BGZ79_010674 [Entomortierella chlamydospora]KAG0024770.1 hypothetical protein BGZ80_007705 [Entomortierella chlamydospora]
MAKGITWTISVAALLSYAVSAVMAGAGMVVDQSDPDHSNYGDMGKAKEFAKEHMGEKAKTLSQKEELMMLFSLHDSNKDGFLDGIELRAAFSDYAHSDESNLSLEKMHDMIDHVIEEDDTNNDGKISWEEYLISQKYHEAN